MTGQGRPPQEDPRRQLGARGEEFAARWYVAHGYRVLDRNWRCRQGELDLVVDRAGLVVFCEVKTRRSVAYGTPAEAVGWRKQQRIRGLAAAWLRGSGVRARELRFDVASVLLPARGSATITVLEGAF